LTVNHLAKGLYYVQVATGDYTVVRKLIVE
jgi:hypothetical protein